MCDYSLHNNVKSRPAKVGDKLTTHDFGTGTRGFSASEDKHVAVCLMPGTELSFKEEVRRVRLWPWGEGVIKHKTAIFRQINRNIPMTHHHALEFPARGFCAPEDQGMAVCLLPGTELSFAEEVRQWSKAPWSSNVTSYRTAIFRQVNKDKAYTHHDALEFPDGKVVLLTTLKPGQQATVLQLPAEPQRAQEKPAANTAVQRNLADALG